MHRVAAISVFICFIILGCETGQTGDDTTYTDSDVDLATTEFAESAEARISGLDGHAVEGLITFEESDGFLTVSGSISNLEPGKHGFHVHAGTSCEERGGHFNPQDTEHGSPDEQSRHVGDLGNLVADSTGTANFERVDRKLSLTGDNSIAGRALVVHAGEDTYLAQPSGDSGREIGCGIITMD